MRPARIAVACLLAASGVHAQPPTGPAMLDLVLDSVSLRGGPLTLADFEVTESGRTLDVQAVRLVEPSTGGSPIAPIATESEERAAAAAADRIVGVYVDEYHLSGNDAFEAAKRAVAAFIRTSLGPRDLVVALKPLDSIVAIRLDTDRERAATLVEGAQPRQGDYTARTQFEQDFLSGTPSRMESARNRIVVSGVGALAAHLGRFPGRKSLIVLSNGFSGAVLPLAGDQPRAGTDSLLRAANRGGVAVYAVRPSPPSATARDVSTRDDTSADGLSTLALGTTGFVIDGPDALAPGLGRLLADASRHYILSVATPPEAGDGRYHAVDVRVRRAGVSVRARGGFALRRSDDGVRRPAVRPLPEGLRVPRRVSPLIRTWFGQSPGQSGLTEIAFVWEPAPPRAGDRAGRPEAARVAMSVTTMDGEPVFAGESRAGGQAAVPATRPYLLFEAAPATLLVRMEIFDLTGRTIDTDARDLVVGAYRGPVSFGTAAVYRARTMRDLRGFEDHPFAMSPVASRQFSRAEQLVVRIPVNAPGSTPVVTARLQSGFGALLRPLPVVALDGAPGVFQVELPLASLASGRYVVEFIARVGDASAVERAEFTVTP